MPGWISSSIKQDENRYQVIVRDWFSQGMFPSKEAAEEFFKLKIEGRIKDEDWRIRESGKSFKRYHLETYVWSAWAEFLTEEMCYNFIEQKSAELEGKTHQVAMRNSSEAALLLEYGTKKLARMGAIRELQKQKSEEPT